MVTKDFQTVKIATIGDSLTKAVSSNNSLELSDIVSFINNPDLEDFSKDFLIENIENSWVLGSELFNGGSHAQRISRLTNRPMETFDASQIGAQAVGLLIDGPVSLNFGLESDLGNQAQAVAQNLDDNDLNYVTIMIGTNDICANGLFNRSLDEFKTLLREKMYQAIATVGPKADLILLSSIPDVKAVFASPETCQWNSNSFTADLDVQSIVKDLTCGFVDDPQFDAFVQGANQIYAEIAASSPHPVVYDGGAVYNTSVEPQDVGVDCFHPSKTGQEKLAATLWRSVEEFFTSNLK